MTDLTGHRPTDPVTQDQSLFTGQNLVLADRINFRRTSPRFVGDNFQKNIEVLDQVVSIASAKGVTTSQLALAWVLAQGGDVVPIPGTRRIPYLEENVAAVDISLTVDELAAIEKVAPRGIAAGARYAPPWMQSVGH